MKAPLPVQLVHLAKLPGATVTYMFIFPRNPESHICIQG